MSALPTLTALRASADSGSSITFTATVSDLSAGGATPSGGTVTFSDQKGTIGTGTLSNGVATYTTSGIAPGTITVSAAYGGTSSFAASTTGTIVTAAGDGKAGYSGDNGPATEAELSNPRGLAVDAAGDIFIADYANNVVREIVKATGDIITVAGDGKAGYTGDGGAATAAELDGPRGVAVDAAGDLYISDMNNNVVREVLAGTGDIITVAGDGKAGYEGDDGPATSAELNTPRGLAIDSSGDLFIADFSNNAIREVLAGTGKIITVAGDGKAGYKGDGGPATSAELNLPASVDFDSAGDLLIDDYGNNAVREVVKSTGKIITVAGDGKAGYAGDGGLATAAELNEPDGLAFDSAGDLFIADSANNVIREVVAATGDIITVAGDGKSGYSGDNGPATAAELDVPTRMVVDSAGDVFIPDSGDNVVREFTTAVTVTITAAPAPSPKPTPEPVQTTSSNPRWSTSLSTVLMLGTPSQYANGSLTPLPAVSPRFVTRTSLSVQPMSPQVGQEVALIATVRFDGGTRVASGGSVTFLDGTTDLGTAAVSHGRAKLVTSALLPGRNRLEVVYNPGRGMVPSQATLIANVRSVGSAIRVASARRIPPSDAAPAPAVPSAGAGLSDAMEALTPPGGAGSSTTPTLDQGISGAGSARDERRKGAP